MTNVQDMHERQRVVRSQNEHAMRETAAAGGTFVCWCECHDPNCRETFSIDERDYQQAREQQGYIVLLSHVDRSTDRPVQHLLEVAVVVPRGPHAQQQEEPEHEEEHSVIDALKEKVKDVVDAPKAADYDTTKTNPVTGMRREP